MKKPEVSFRPLAEADLFELYRRIADEAGVEIAGTYIDRIEAACMTLATFPRRCTRRDDTSAQVCERSDSSGRPPSPSR